MNPLSTVRVIIQYKTPSTQPIDQKVAGVLGSVFQHFNSIKGGVYELPASSLAALASDPNVSFISPDRAMTAKLDNTAAAVNVPALWTAGLSGAGIGVAVIDTASMRTPIWVPASRPFSATLGRERLSARRELADKLYAGCSFQEKAFSERSHS